MRRRAFLAALAASGMASLPGCAGPPRPSLPPGVLLGPELDLGQLLRERTLPSPSETRRVQVLVVGAGVGGLAAGWKLAKAGCTDFLLVDMEATPGGNARSGRNEVSAYPLAAHYLPLPRYDERYLCAVPQERLYRNGWWQDGLLPQSGVGAVEQAQYRRFQALMEGFKQRRDGGRRAFAIPMALSSRAPDLRALDALSMRDWLLGQGLDSPHLHWYVDYACRDDYGSASSEVSAWAGIHYFACRDGQAQDAAGDTVLTAPGGNAWLVEGMLRSISDKAGDRLLAGAALSRSARLRRPRRLARRGRRLHLRAVAGGQPDAGTLSGEPCRCVHGLGQRAL